MTRNNLKKILGDWITELTNNIGVVTKTPKKFSYPYIQISLNSSSNEVRLRDDIIVDIDFWNNSDSSEFISNQAELVKIGLNYAYYSDDNGFFQSHIIFEGDIMQDTPNMSRLQQRYLLKVR